MKLLVTGGAGFIGSNFIKYWLQRHSTDTIINLDTLTYAANPKNLQSETKNYRENYKLIVGNIANPRKVDDVISSHRPDIIVNFAAESHNSRASADPSIFFRTNVIGTQTLLEAARKTGCSRFHQISTCEVFGDLDLDSTEVFSEDSPYRPRTPYNASKAGADMAVRAYFETFKLPVTISTCCNNYGKYQFPEKLIPLFVTNLLQDKQVPIYKQSHNRREWLHVLDHCRAIELILERGVEGESYNVGSGTEKSVEEITNHILEKLGKPQTMKSYVEDRPGHDRRYLLDSSKLKQKLGWEPVIGFRDGLNDTIEWYAENPDWWKPLLERVEIDERKWAERK